MTGEDFYHLEKRIISRKEFFEVPEEEIRQVMNYDSAVKVMKKVVGARPLKFYDYGDNKDIDVPPRISESEAMVRVELSRFLRRVLGDIPSYYDGKYRIPIKYRGHPDIFRKEFWDYFKETL